jgi:hypothetical protein
MLVLCGALSSMDVRYTCVSVAAIVESQIVLTQVWHMRVIVSAEIDARITALILHLELVSNYTTSIGICCV